MRSCIAVAVLTLLLAGVLLQAHAAAPPMGAAVRKLIDDLGDDDEDVRQAAAKKLEAMGEGMIAVLRRASKQHADVDVRLRAGVLASAIEKRLFGEIHIFTGHQGWVYRVAITADGKHAVSSGDYLRVWDLATSKEVRHFSPGVWAWGLSLSRDGKHVLASHSDRSVRLYELATGKELVKLVRHTGEVWGAGLSPDGKVAVTGGFDRALHAWDARTGKHLRAFENVTDMVRCLTFSPDGKKVAVGHFAAGNVATSAGTVRIWDVQTGKLERSGTGHTGAITSVTWSRDGKWIATSSFDRTVRIWEAKTLREHRKLIVSTVGCDGAALTPDARQVVATGWGNDDPAVRLFDVATGKLLRRYDGHTGGALCVAVTPDGKRALSASTDGTLRLWPLRAR